MSDIKFKSIGFTNVFRLDGETQGAQRTHRSSGNIHARVEPVKVYSTEGRARSYTKPLFEVAEVFVRDAA